MTEQTENSTPAPGTVQQQASSVPELDTSWFTTYTVFARNRHENSVGSARSASEKQRDAEAFRALVADLSEQGITVRGLYDVSGMRAEADVMVWMWGKDPVAVQQAIRQVRRADLFAGTHVAFTAMGADRMAEFNRDHVPAFAMGRKPRKWLCFYPFVRSYDWYTMDPAKRRDLLRSHGQLGQDFPDVWANTVSAFGLNDWEWLLGLEAPRLDMLVDMMRHLRNNETRHYVREEVPFYTGHYIEIDDVAEVLA
ncbi:hydrogen peroxide-dependent heme synthase [Auritidibacter ignavus]|uniref:hydrogen peroxide-dependent heme synthase n=1 Tax=Auritidibacter ignavus TaxID=678932 RepID=UPI00244BB4A0|nr:hydrogen peroxide-dependent heme synthase [Auritidibacter ignavus]WGH83943.1 chlorite dismutase family protein [Auritidibacter ignavus]